MSTKAKQIEALFSGVYNPTTGSPLAAGTVSFYSAGTDTVKNVWTEKSQN